MFTVVLQKTQTILLQTLYIFNCLYSNYDNKLLYNLTFFYLLKNNVFHDMAAPFCLQCQIHSHTNTSQAN